MLSRRHPTGMAGKVAGTGNRDTICHVVDVAAMGKETRQRKFEF